MGEQLAIDFEALELPADKARAFRVIDDEPDTFAPEFREWLLDNWHVWLRFVEEAHKVRFRGRTHYSARTIIHYLRHETLVAERDAVFKINNNCSPDCSRLYMALYPAAEHFFETRIDPRSVRRV